MSNLERLRQATENTLHDLTADDSLKFRILQKASMDHEPVSHSTRTLRPIPLLCTVAAVLLIGIIALNSYHPVPASVPGELNSFTAGSDKSDSGPVFPAEFDPENVSSVEFSQFGVYSKQEQCNTIIDILQNQAMTAEPSELVSEDRMVVTMSDDTKLIYRIQPPYLIGQDGQWWLCHELFDALNHFTE